MAYSNSLGNSTLSPYSPPRPTWEATGAAFSYDKGVIYISGYKSTVTSDLDNSLVTMKQPILYTNNGVEELGNIVGIHMEGKGVQHLYTTNLDGGREFRVEATSLSLPTGGAPAEVASQQSKAAALAKTAMEAVKFSEEAMAAATAGKLEMETAATKKHAIESTHQREAAEVVKRRAAIA